MGATGTPADWELSVRFPDHEALDSFRQHCSGEAVDLEVTRLYNPVPPGAGERYGLSRVQSETLTRAVRDGYYSIPRRLSTQSLAEEFDISDQAVTERLRRAIVTLAGNTLLAAEDPAEGSDPS